MMDAITFNDAVETDTAGATLTTKEAAEDAVVDGDGLSGEITPVAEGNDGTEAAEPAEIDYEKLIEDDIRELKSAFPELAEMTDINALPNAMRYATLRDLGLTATEAYLATSAKERRRDNRSHLVTAVSRSAGVPRGAMSREELAIAKDLLPNMSDAQIYDLYKRVKK